MIGCYLLLRIIVSYSYSAVLAIFGGTCDRLSCCARNE